MLKRRLASAAAILLVALSPFGRVALAEPLKSVAGSAGLLGVWTTDCSKPPTAANPYISFEATPTGGVNVVYDNGPPNGSLLAVLESLSIVSPTTVAVRLRYSDPKWGKGNGNAFDMILELKDGRKRTIRSALTDGRLYIKDGINIVDGRPSAIQQRCKIKPIAHLPNREAAQG